MSINVSGIIFSSLTSIVILFQIALALGAPWGGLRWEESTLGGSLSICE